MELDQRRSDPIDVVGRDHHARARLANQVGSGAVGRHDGEDGPSRRDVLEHLPGEDTLPSPACIRHEQEQGLGVALEPERVGPREVVDDLEPIAEVERLGPLAV